jgi:hypothetical protein
MFSKIIEFERKCYCLNILNSDLVLLLTNYIIVRTMYFLIVLIYLNCFCIRIPAPSLVVVVLVNALVRLVVYFFKTNEKNFFK